MEIGSMDSMTGMMGMQGMMQGMQKPDASEMSTDFVDMLDSDGDGLLSESEFSVEGAENTESTEAFDALDTNEDGFVSQEELEADMTAKMGSMPPPPPQGFGGVQTGGDSDSFQQLMDMVGSNTGKDQSSGTEQYSMMQESMFGGNGSQNMAFSGLSIRA